ncbi:hypothetical protein SEA_SCHWARTZ33_79 [Gordonia phage Schwartz33]|nr:hypothetical protein SEA_SCHWARTZ33_79 [Gordonia phage Schwartz33]
MRKHNGVRVLSVPLSLEEGPQVLMLGIVKVLMATEGPKSTKTVDIHYEVDTASYEWFNRSEAVFHVVRIGKEVPPNTEHVASLVLRSGDPIHIYREVQKEMEYTLLIVDESLSHTLIEGYANSSGLMTTLKCFTDLEKDGRDAFMSDLLWKGAAEYKASAHDPFPYSVTATGVVGSKGVE